MKVSRNLVFVFVFGLMVVVFPALASTLTVMQTEAPLTMDPSNHTAGYTAAVLNSMYECLTKFDYEMKIVPGLAIDWQATNDGKTWTFELRRGVVFHDGEDFTAEAVKKSFERLLDPNNGLATRGRFAPVISKIEVVNDYQVKFYLKATYPSFDRLVSMGSASIISPKALDDGISLAKNVIGTGPFKFVEWVTGEHVLTEKNNDYWGGIPQVDQLKWKWSPEKSVLVMALQTGEADVIYPLPPAYANSLKKSPKIKVMETETDQTFWLSLNTLHKPLDNVKVRQALNYATDRNGLIKAIARGYGKIANSPMGPISFGYDPACEAYPFDPAKAKELLREAGYADGFEVPIAVQEAETSYAEALQGMWSELGIDVKIYKMEYAHWADQVFTAKGDNKGYSVIASWASGALDADTFLKPLFHTASFPPAGANLGFYSNLEVDQLLNEGVITVDPEKRKEIYSKAQKIIQNEGAHISFYYAKKLAGVRSNIQGVWIMGNNQIVLNEAFFE